MDEEMLEIDPTGDWLGKRIDWDSEISDAKLHVELPFWIAVPDGSIILKGAPCELEVQFRNSIVGVYRQGHFFRDERSLMQITAEGMPFHEEQQEELDQETKYGQRHFRTMLTMPVKCHTSVFELLSSADPRDRRDGKMYVQSLSHASIRYVNLFITAYRTASYDPFVTHVSYWDLPVWHLSSRDGQLWHVPMAAYPVSDTLQPIHPHLPLLYRTTIGRLREAVLSPVPPSLEELLDAWTCFYRRQFAEAIRKVVTAIEVALTDLVGGLPEFRQGRTSDEVDRHLRKMKFNEQLACYLRITGRKLPGPLTHIAPEVNGIRLEEELERARNIRHKIVHESAKVDYEHDGPLLKIMETMSWLHGWLREDRFCSDPTESPLYNINEGMRKLFLLEPLADSAGLRLIPPAELTDESAVRFLHQIHIEKLVDAASPGNSDSEFCVAWAFQAIGRQLVDGKRRHDWDGHHERYWIKLDRAIRPLFIIDTDTLLSRSDIESICCRFTVLRSKHSECEMPLIILNHLQKRSHQERQHIPCVGGSVSNLLLELAFTVISLTDWVAMTCLMTADGSRNFGFEQCCETRGLYHGLPSQFAHVGHVRRVFERLDVVSLVVETDSVSIGDELCFRDGCTCVAGTVESLQVEQADHETAMGGCTAGVRLSIGVCNIARNSNVYKIKRPRLTHDASVKAGDLPKREDALDNLWRSSQLPIMATGHGIYGESNELGG